CKVIINLPARVGNFKDFAVLARLGVTALDGRTACRGSVSERPVVARDLACCAPRLRTIEDGLVASENQTVRSGQGDKLGRVFSLVRFPQKGVALLDAPKAG